MYRLTRRWGVCIYKLIHSCETTYIQCQKLFFPVECECVWVCPFVLAHILDVSTIFMISIELVGFLQILSLVPLRMNEWNWPAVVRPVVRFGQLVFVEAVAGSSRRRAVCFYVFTKLVTSFVCNLCGWCVNCSLIVRSLTEVSVLHVLLRCCDNVVCVTYLLLSSYCFSSFMFLQVAIKIIDKTQLNSSSLQKVGGVSVSVVALIVIIIPDFTIHGLPLWPIV